MFRLVNLFRPITSRPDSSGKSLEITPCDYLKPYIRCFWGINNSEFNRTNNDILNFPNIIIPDACMDIIFEIKSGNNKINNVFLGINDHPFYDIESTKETAIETFAIRFHFWSVHMFSIINMQEVLNVATDAEEYFGDLKKKIEVILQEKKTFEERVREVEKLLIERLEFNKRTNADLMNAIYYILHTKGVVSVSELSSRIALSKRQLERQFSEYIGISPKKISEIVRFQNIWQDIFYGRERNIQDLVYKYSLTDQAHFYNDFRKYAGKTPTETLKNAR